MVGFFFKKFFFGKRVRAGVCCVYVSSSALVSKTEEQEEEERNRVKFDANRDRNLNSLDFPSLFFFFFWVVLFHFSLSLCFPVTSYDAPSGFPLALSSSTFCFSENKNYFLDLILYTFSIKFF